jgi:hypothetical protein
MPSWTVIGYYVDNNQAWAGSYEAETYEEAEAKAHAEHPEDYDPDNPEHEGPEIVIVGVVEGQHTVWGGDYPDGD